MHSILDILITVLVNIYYHNDKYLQHINIALSSIKIMFCVKGCLKHFLHKVIYSRYESPSTKSHKKYQKDV